MIPWLTMAALVTSLHVSILLILSEKMVKKLMRKPKAYKRKPKKQGKPRQRSGDYRIFVGAFPNGDKIDQIQQLRQQVDAKTAQITPPHVTLAGSYWRTGRPTAANEGVLIEKLTSLAPYLKPFSLQLGGIYTFGQRVIYLGVLPTEEMMAIRKSLLRVMGQDKHRQFRPHLTVAMRLKGSQFEESLALLRQSEWENGRFSTSIHELQLMLRGPNDLAWRTIHTLPLTSQENQS
jgi:2'-5' RNA ligase